MNDNKMHLFDYNDRDNVIYNLSGLSKLICMLLLSFSVMLNYDIRCIMAIMVFTYAVFYASKIAWKQVRLMLIYVGVFLIINFVLGFVFSPGYGTELYGTSHPIFAFSEHYTVTQEELFYLVSKAAKYAAVVPVGLIFILTTNPSEFASSLNAIGLPYKGTYSVALTLRYFPDLIREFKDISVAQQSRGLDMSRKEKLGTRIANVVNILVPLVFSSMDRVEMISNAMDLRGFGKNKKRTWYSRRKLQRNDYIAVAICGAIFLFILYMNIFVNHSRFWNPFI